MPTPRKATNSRRKSPSRKTPKKRTSTARRGSSRKSPKRGSTRKSPKKHKSSTRKTSTRKATPKKKKVVVTEIPARASESSIPINVLSAPVPQPMVPQPTAPQAVPSKFRNIFDKSYIEAASKPDTAIVIGQKINVPLPNMIIARPDIVVNRVIPQVDINPYGITVGAPRAAATATAITSSSPNIFYSISPSKQQGLQSALIPAPKPSAPSPETAARARTATQALQIARDAAAIAKAKEEAFRTAAATRADAENRLLQAVFRKEAADIAAAKAEQAKTEAEEAAKAQREADAAAALAKVAAQREKAAADAVAQAEAEAMAAKRQAEADALAAKRQADLEAELLQLTKDSSTDAQTGTMRNSPRQIRIVDRVVNTINQVGSAANEAVQGMLGNPLESTVDIVPSSAGSSPRSPVAAVPEPGTAAATAIATVATKMTPAAAAIADKVDLTRLANACLGKSYKDNGLNLTDERKAIGIKTIARQLNYSGDYNKDSRNDLLKFICDEFKYPFQKSMK